MSFGAGMGAGMGAGIGAGIAIGIASGQKKALGQIRDYLIVHEMTIYDSTGNEVPPELLLNEAVSVREGAKGERLAAALIVALLAGITLLGVMVYFAFL